MSYEYSINSLEDDLVELRYKVRKWEVERQMHQECSLNLGFNIEMAEVKIAELEAAIIKLMEAE